MSYLKIILLTFLLLLISSKGEMKKSRFTFSDHAVMKIKNRVVFLSDIKERLKDLNDFKCLIPASYLGGAIQLNRPDFKLEDNKKRVYSAIAKIEILGVFLEGQGMFIDKKFLKSLDNRKCSQSSKFDKWSKYLGGLVRIESFLRDRFKLEKVAAGKHERKSKALSSVRAFVNTLSRQTKTVYFK